MTKLKSVKVALRGWNRSRVGNVTNIVETGKKELDCIWTRLQINPLDMELIRVKRGMSKRQLCNIKAEESLKRKKMR